jgi:signal transduction histidine kinase
VLRKKLLSRIGLLMVAFVLGAVVAVWVLQDVLGDVDRANADAMILMDGIQAVGSAVTRLEGGNAASPDLIAQSAADLRTAMDRLARHPATRPADPGLPDLVAGPAAEAFARLELLLPDFLARRRGNPAVPNLTTVLASTNVHAAIDDLGRELRNYVAAEQRHVARYFRGIVLALTLAALAMVNVAVIVLLRTAQLVLKPVGALVEGSRQLAAENFEHRVKLDQGDEFGELAHAYNQLAERLQANEERRTETLRHLAVTLNHGLNNAMSIIELQLGLLDRQSGGNPTLRNHLREIRTCLSRMADIVASLKHIRRVVLTDYAPGQKMVDLERSVETADPPVAASVRSES